ncbi:MAG: hypothetical protein EOP84_06375 [Verrucomicrobiaceae bacterium]|nr:MAG: hypothetical protein EOP84_06375 [Verrucomicrobiaceae bacterium]
MATVTPVATEVVGPKISLSVEETIQRVPNISFFSPEDAATVILSEESACDPKIEEVFSLIMLSEQPLSMRKIGSE